MCTFRRRYMNVARQKPSGRLVSVVDYEDIDFNQCEHASRAGLNGFECCPRWKELPLLGGVDFESLAPRPGESFFKITFLSEEEYWGRFSALGMQEPLQGTPQGSLPIRSSIGSMPATLTEQTLPPPEFSSMHYSPGFDAFSTNSRYNFIYSAHGASYRIRPPPSGSPNVKQTQNPTALQSSQGNSRASQPRTISQVASTNSENPSVANDEVFMTSQRRKMARPPVLNPSTTHTSPRRARTGSVQSQTLTGDFKVLQSSPGSTPRITGSVSESTEHQQHEVTFPEQDHQLSFSPQPGTDSQQTPTAAGRTSITGCKRKQAPIEDPPPPLDRPITPRHTRPLSISDWTTFPMKEVLENPVAKNMYETACNAEYWNALNDGMSPHEIREIAQHPLAGPFAYKKLPYTNTSWQTNFKFEADADMEPNPHDLTEREFADYANRVWRKYGRTDIEIIRRRWNIFYHVYNLSQGEGEQSTY